MATLLHDVELALDPPDYVLTERENRGTFPPAIRASRSSFNLLGRRPSAALLMTFDTGHAGKRSAEACDALFPGAVHNPSEVEPTC